MTADELRRLGPVLPIATIDDADEAVPLARALREGGVGALEVTLRTPAALDAIAAIAAAVPELAVGAGTVRDPAQAEAAREAGAGFLVTPGTTPALLEALAAAGLPALCGCATASEAMALLERGFAALKLFPAEPLGGPELVRALAGPLPEAVFCPTGGIGPRRAPDYLALANVVAVGGSWVTARDPLAPDWDAVTRRARAAAALRPPGRS